MTNPLPQALGQVCNLQLQSAMTSYIFSDLQKVDSDADRWRQRLAAIAQTRAERLALDAAMAEAQAAQTTAEQQRRQLRERELELKTLEAKIKDVGERLYGGRIRNPKELENLQKESQSLQQHQGKIEETVLQLMESSEQSDATAKQTQSHWVELQSARQQQEADWQAEAALLSEQLKVLEGKAQALRAQADSDDLKRYDRLRRTRGGLAVAPLNGFSCGACGLGVSMDAVQMTRDEEKLAACDNCGRILVAS